MKRKAAKRRPDPARVAFEEYPRLRIRWIDRLTNVITEMPGPPVASEVNRTCAKLLGQLESYRDGFVHMLNHSERKR